MRMQDAFEKYSVTMIIFRKCNLNLKTIFEKFVNNQRIIR